MMKHLTPLLTVLLVAVALSGCSDDENYVTIEGSLSLELGYAEAGFNFDAATPLVSDAQQATPGCAAGWCLIRLGDGCEPTSLEVFLERGADGEQGYGFETFDVSISEGEAVVEASVAATEGDVFYTSSGSAACTVSDLSGVSADGTASLAVDCDLSSDDANRTAHANADLFLDGCMVE